MSHAVGWMSLSSVAQITKSDILEYPSMSDFVFYCFAIKNLIQPTFNVMFNKTLFLNLTAEQRTHFPVFRKLHTGYTK